MVAAPEQVTTPPRASRSSTPNAAPPVGGTTPTAPALVEPTPNAPAPALSDPLLALLADIVDDLERTRIANENRLRQLTRTGIDKDGGERGFGLDTDLPQVAAVASLVAGLLAMEKQAVTTLEREMRDHRLGPWIKATKGVGEKQGARLLAAIGDPYWNTLHDRPRTVSELWAYCGLDPRDGVARSRTKGQKSNWSADAKMRAYLIAEKCMVGRKRECVTDGQTLHVEDCRCSPYRLVYDDGRAKYAGAVHHADCRRCGPAGKPALAGSALSDGHKQARALRLVSKEVLKDMWRESKRLHDTNGDLT